MSCLKKRKEKEKEKEKDMQVDPRDPRYDDDDDESGEDDVETGDETEGAGGADEVLSVSGHPYPFPAPVTPCRRTPIAISDTLIPPAPLPDNYPAVLFPLAEYCHITEAI